MAARSRSTRQRAPSTPGPASPSPRAPSPLAPGFTSPGRATAMGASPPHALTSVDSVPPNPGDQLTWISGSGCDTRSLPGPGLPGSGGDQPPLSWHPQGPLHPSTPPRATTGRMAPAQLLRPPPRRLVWALRNGVARGEAGRGGALVGARCRTSPNGSGRELRKIHVYKKSPRLPPLDFYLAPSADLERLSQLTRMIDPAMAREPKTLCQVSCSPRRAKPSSTVTTG